MIKSIDNNENLYSLKSHQFGATFVRELMKQKIPIAHIIKQFFHVSIEMASHYFTLEVTEELKDENKRIREQFR